MPLYIASDQYIRFTEVKDTDGNFVNDGTCTFSITKKYGGTVILTGTLDYVEDSDGEYEKLVTAAQTNSLLPAISYYLTVSFTGPDNERVTKRVELQAEYP